MPHNGRAITQVNLAFPCAISFRDRTETLALAMEGGVLTGTVLEDDAEEGKGEELCLRRRRELRMISKSSSGCVKAIPAAWHLDSLIDDPLPVVKGIRRPSTVHCRTVENGSGGEGNDYIRTTVDSQGPFGLIRRSS